MSDYCFETSEFGVSDEGIHLLRSRFNYKTISYPEVDTLTIEKGKELSNWMIILTIGFCLFSFSLYYTFRLFTAINNNEVPVIHLEEILVPLIPFMLGGYCLYSSTRNTTILKVKTSRNKSDKLSLRELEKDNRLHDEGQAKYKLIINT